MKDEILDEMFSMGGIEYVNFSVNGYSRETYEKIMVPLKREKTYRNIIYFLEK